MVAVSRYTKNRKPACNIGQLVEQHILEFIYRPKKLQIISKRILKTKTRKKIKGFIGPLEKVKLMSRFEVS